jgi:hypothetical protein
VMYTHAHNNGMFMFEQLPYGTYKVWAEMPGRVTIPTYIKLDENNPTVKDLQIVVGKNAITTSVRSVASLNSLQGVSVYPNPTADNLFVSADKMEEISNIVVSNVWGKQLINQEHTGGANSEAISLQGLPHGLYFVTITAKNGNNSTYRILKN